MVRQLWSWSNSNAVRYKRYSAIFCKSYCICEDIESVVAKLKKKGAELFSEIQNYDNAYKLCFVRGPEGIILELAEKIG